MEIENKMDAQFDSLQFNQPVLASRFKRWLASLINGVLLWILLAIGLALGDITGIFFMLIYVALQLYFMKTYGQTIAKRWLGLRVLDNDTKQPVEFGKYVGREIIDTLLASTNVLLFVSGIVALVRDDRRSLTDLVIGTVVVSEK